MITLDDKLFVLEEYLFDIDTDIEVILRQINNSTCNNTQEKMERQEMYDVLKLKLDRQAIVNRWIMDLNS